MSKKWHAVWVVIVVLIITLGVSGFLLQLFAKSPTAVSLPLPSPPIQSTQAEWKALSTSAPETVVAQVNGRIIDRANLQTTQATDQAMAALLGQAAPESGPLLDRLVNNELVWQAAQTAGFTLDKPQATHSLQAFLAEQDQTLPNLEQALAAVGSDLDSFIAYYGRLHLINQFAQQQSQAQGITIVQFVTQLQKSAQISFGPAASLADNRPQPITAVIPTAVPTMATAIATPAATSIPATPIPTPNDQQVRGIGTGQLAPDFALSSLNHTNDYLSFNELQGQPTVLAFWATWCPYCRAQTPILIAAAQQTPGIHFVGIDVQEDATAVQTYIEQQEIPYPILLDSDGAVAAAYQVSGFPTTYFLDSQGAVVARHIGQLTPENLQAYLAKLLPIEGAAP